MYILNQLPFIYKYKLAVQSIDLRPILVSVSLSETLCFVHTVPVFPKRFVIFLWKQQESPEKLLILYVYVNSYVLVVFKNAC